MPEQYKFYDKDGAEIVDKRTAVHSLGYFRERGRRNFEGEIEKTEFHLELIRTANQIVSMIFRTLKVDKDVQVDPEQVHFLHSDAYKKARESETTGSYLSVDGSICINVDKLPNNAKAIATVLHEVLHAVSEQSFFYYNAGDQSIISDARVGLRTRDQNLETVSMTGINEFLVESVVAYCLNITQKTLKSRFGISEEDLRGKIYAEGLDHNDLMYKLFEKMAGDIEPKLFAIYILRAHFSGELNILQKFNEVFGQSAVEVLGYLGCFYHKETDEKGNALVNEYFISADDARKGEILQILRAMKNEQLQKKLNK